MKQHRKNNCLLILDYIKKNGSITTDEARFKLKVRRLSARIFDIRHIMKIDINSNMINSKNDKYAVYTLGK